MFSAIRNDLSIAVIMMSIKEDQPHFLLLLHLKAKIRVTAYKNFFPKLCLESSHCIYYRLSSSPHAVPSDLHQIPFDAIVCGQSQIHSHLDGIDRSPKKNEKRKRTKN